MNQEGLDKFRARSLNSFAESVDVTSMTRYGLTKELLVDTDVGSGVWIAHGFARKASSKLSQIDLLTSGVVFNTVNPPRTNMSALSPLFGGTRLPGIAGGWYVGALPPDFTLPPLIDGNPDFKALSLVVDWVCLDSKNLRLQVSDTKVRNLDNKQWVEARAVLDIATLKQLFSMRTAMPVFKRGAESAGRSMRKRNAPETKNTGRKDDGDALDSDFDTDTDIDTDNSCTRKLFQDKKSKKGDKGERGQRGETGKAGKGYRGERGLRGEAGKRGERGANGLSEEDRGLLAECKRNKSGARVLLF